MKTDKNHWLERPILSGLPGITNEVALFALIIVLTIITRFFDLESRVMSHDESLHTYFSWLYSRGQGYQHSPMMHGPLQFHLIAISYFIFGVSDFTSRIPAVLFSIASVWMVWYWRRYLGKTGALVAGFLMVISPFMLYYGRYVRNEAFAGLAGILMLYAILRFLENGKKIYLYLLALSLVLHFTSKETAFIYAAQALLFLGIYFVTRIVDKKSWKENDFHFLVFIFTLAIGILLVFSALGVGLLESSGSPLLGSETAMPVDPDMPLASQAESSSEFSITITLIVSALAMLLIALGALIIGYGWNRLILGRIFGLIIVIGTLVLPMLSPFGIDFLNNFLSPDLQVTIPTTPQEITAMMESTPIILGIPWDIFIMGIVISITIIGSIYVGLKWRRDWWKFALLFWGLFTVLYTSVFTNGTGFFTGLVGSLGYWLVQQGVERGSQPAYYYVLVQLPVYEFLPIVGTLLALFLAIPRWLKSSTSPTDSDKPENDLPHEQIADGIEESQLESEATFKLSSILLFWWIITSLLAFSYAGERMPWLTYHIAWPMILFSGWGIGQLVEKVNWQQLPARRISLTLILTILLIIGLYGSISSLVGPTPPFQGKGLEQLQATSAFLFPIILSVVCAAGLAYILGDEIIGLVKVVLSILLIMGLIGTIIVILTIPTAELAEGGQLMVGASSLLIILVLTIASLVALIVIRNRDSGAFPSLVTLTFIGFLTILTMRASFRASYFTFDYAREYLVYAHGAPGIKQVMAQAKEISQRTTGGMGINLSYDASAPDTGVSWPFVWYLRDYTNQRSFDKPTKALRDSVFVVVDAKNFEKIEPALGPGYYRFDYIRMWWPNQDYFGLNKDRIANAILNPEIRNGIWDIWFHRDYTKYAAATGKTDLTSTTWQPADLMRIYIRKDLAARIWDYGVEPSETTVDIIDPTEGKDIILTADLVLDNSQLESLELNAPRALAFAPDSTFYVADSRNHRILHFDSDGTVLESWGSYADGLNAPAPNGAFNEPWGIAVGPDGSVYVSDTWNHRIQKFTSEGVPIRTWGQYGQSENQYGFWGPRGIAVDEQGNVYVADTGNKRIIVFDEDGKYITEFGTAGLEPGEFDEPVGVTIDGDGYVYVTDTWNQRVQVFEPAEDKSMFFPDRQWDVFGWYGQSLDNKPFIAVNSDGHVFITDPELYRIIEFTGDGEVVRTWGDYGDSATTFGLASGVAVDPEGRIWVTDGYNNRILRFTLP